MKNRLYDVCVQTAMLLGSETWAVAVKNVCWLERSEACLFHWICNVSMHVQQSVSILTEELDIRGEVSQGKGCCGVVI